MFGFLMTQEIMEEYYKRARQLNAITEEQKTHILFQMVSEGVIQSVFETNMPREQFVASISKHFKLVTPEENKDESKTEGETDGGQIGTIGN